MEKEIKVIKNSLEVEDFDDSEEIKEKLDITLMSQQKIERLVVLAFVVLFLIFIIYTFIL